MITTCITTPITLYYSTGKQGTLTIEYKRIKKHMKKYLVTGTFEYEVEADSVEGAEIAAAEAYMSNPDTDYTVIEVK